MDVFFCSGSDDDWLLINTCLPIHESVTFVLCFSDLLVGRDLRQFLLPPHSHRYPRDKKTY